jgi:hypothetical protein
VSGLQHGNVAGFSAFNGSLCLEDSFISAILKQQTFFDQHSFAFDHFISYQNSKKNKNA